MSKSNIIIEDYEENTMYYCDVTKQVKKVFGEGIVKEAKLYIASTDLKRTRRKKEEILKYIDDVCKDISENYERLDLSDICCSKGQYLEITLANNNILVFESLENGDAVISNIGNVEEY